jgi:hypothetical protein
MPSNTASYGLYKNPRFKVLHKSFTLWDIAKRSLPKNTDIRDYIQEIKAVNQLETSFIKEGEVLEIPVHP